MKEKKLKEASLKELKDEIFQRRVEVLKDIFDNDFLQVSLLTKNEDCTYNCIEYYEKDDLLDFHTDKCTRQIFLGFEKKGKIK